jgi:hypothetical protein
MKYSVSQSVRLGVDLFDFIQCFFLQQVLKQVFSLLLKILCLIIHYFRSTTK